jgi:hypothetical protein
MSLKYSLREFETIGKGQYTLPSDVVAALEQLFRSVGYTQSTPSTYVNQFSIATTTPSKAPAPRAPKRKMDDWKRPAFKATVFAELDTTQTLITEIRSDLNKINDTNHVEKTATIIQKITEIRDLVDFGDDAEMIEKMNTIFNTLFAIAISNKLFAKVYAAVLAEIHAAFDITASLQSEIANYLGTMQNIVDVDSNEDYDAFCEFTTKNTNRKNTTNLLCEIAKTERFEFIRVADIQKITDDLFAHNLASIDHVNKQREVEEITENIVVIFSHFGATFKPAFKDALDTLSTIKKPGLSTRTKFKYMDIVGK